MSEIEFDKYARKGAYHWRDYYGGLLRMNAGVRARYDTVVDCLRRAGVTDSTRLVDIGCGDGARSPANSCRRTDTAIHFPMRPSTPPSVPT